jgi:hypothetical protein
MPVPVRAQGPQQEPPTPGPLAQAQRGPVLPLAGPQQEVQG